MSERESRSKQSGEPSVDDILESIRRIVFEEDDGAPGAGAGASGAEVPAAEVPAAEIPAADVPAVEIPPAEVPAAAAGRTAVAGTVQPAGKDAPPDEALPAVEPPPDVEPASGETTSGETAAGETAAGEEAAGEEAGAAEAAPPDDAAPQGPQEPGPAEVQEPGDPAAPSAGGLGAEPGETVLLLTDMIAPDGSVVRLDPRPAEAPAVQDDPAAGGDGAGEGALDPATQSELAATVREWLDRNAPELVDQAARRELQKLSDRQD